MDKEIPQPTIQAFSRSIFKEATKYGFGQLDVIKLINELIDKLNGIISLALVNRQADAVGKFAIQSKNASSKAAVAKVNPN